MNHVQCWPETARPALGPTPARMTVAGGIVAESVVAAITRADPKRAVIVREARRALTHAIVADAMPRARVLGRGWPNS